MTAAIHLIDKPGGITSHDVVARARRTLGTRRIGHAGTLDPMATGLLILGVDAATRLLTFMVGLDKTYLATIRLGVTTDTDDADGVVTGAADTAGVTDAAIGDGIRALSGSISQVPSRVSAIKVGGRRAYDLARAGEDVVLAPRAVTVERFDVLDARRGEHLDLDVVVDCSSGTYIRALARDLGDSLGVGGHLTALRRTRIGPFHVADASDEPSDATGIDPATAAAAVLERLDVTAEQARDLRHGKKIHGAPLSTDRAAAIDPNGDLVGVVETRGDSLRSVMNMPESA